MSLPEIWFLAIAVLFGGYFLLEGFDFGVGMLMPVLGRRRGETVAEGDTRRRVVLNTIGPVWDGNEVWVITAVGAMFAAFPAWYAGMLSALYLPMLLVLVGLILRVVAIEWRGKIDDPRWRRWCDIGIGAGSWVPAFIWGLTFANLVRGLPIDGDGRFVGGLGDLLSPYALLGGLTTVALFAVHGAVFLGLKTDGVMRIAATRAARRLAPPAAVVVAAFAGWTQLEHGHALTVVAAVACVGALIATSVVVTSGHGTPSARREAVAFATTAVAIVALTVLLFGSLWPAVIPSTLDPAFSVTIADAASSAYTLRIISWASLVVLPVVIGYQAWTYWVFRQRISLQQIPASIGVPLRRDAGAR
ncbi:cytochrome d ubiquinol oxidase subunit II [Williamsia serinedens]|uniref:Cytochrome d ubiquinol oxidase subunit II n=1 Tax=Williamsia serinedens TaxID=391736 RepID=A0ABT1H1C7_9NOCA|nr:cytochrome d ubiquinol oxidase subunit II [Williamsia serinedens]MCP2160991.1 cytochrome d ubiquinol oxidase subunit II [Williamsia serinedens]